MTVTNLPELHYGFLLLTAITLFLFYLLTGKKPVILIVSILWLSSAALLAHRGFFLETAVVPPRIAFLLVPMLIVGLIFGFSPWTARFRRAEMLEGWHYFHGIRILVETIFLYGLWRAGFIARELTFAGNNYDIVPGVLGLLVGYFVFRKQQIQPKWAVAFNCLGILVLANTVVQAILSAPSPFQQLSLEQPTVAVLYFPFIWLPAFVAPLMFWAHFVSLKLLLSPSEASH